MRQTKHKESERIDAAIEKAFYIHFNRVQIPMMDIPKIYQRARVLMQTDNFTADQAVETIALIYKEEQETK